MDIAEGTSQSCLQLYKKSDPAQSGPTHHPNIFCGSCKAQVGFFNIHSRSVSIYKWRARCDAISTPSTAAPELSHCLSAALIAAASRTGSSKLLLTELGKTLASNGSVGHNEADILHLWILNNNIIYTSTAQKSPTVAIKLLYKSVDAQQAERLLQPITSDVQELGLPRDEIQTTAELLVRSSAMLPLKERSFKNWNVGLLAKYPL